MELRFIGNELCFIVETEEERALLHHGLQDIEKVIVGDHKDGIWWTLPVDRDYKGIRLEFNNDL